MGQSCSHESKKEMNHLIARTGLCCLIFLLLFFNGTKAEQLKRRLVIGTPKSDPFASEDIPNGGFYPELIKEIFHQMKYDVEIRFLPFKRIILMLENGTIAGSALVSYQEARTRFLIYPEKALYTDKLKIFGLKTGLTMAKFVGLENLKGSTVGTFRGGFVEKELAKIGVRYEPVATHEQNIGKLLSGRIDYIIAPEVTLKYLIKQQVSVDNQAKIIGYDPPYKEDKHYVAFSKAYPNALEISKDFTQGLYLIQENGTFDKIKAKYIFSEK